ncbi:MAG: enoyl-CoA hydratase-related protein [Bacteroidota bacterium]|jgi:enoyl-CoA hydratase|nr:MAG: enoyl-CoA hydratase [Bacteroidota bacterium]
MPLLKTLDADGVLVVTFSRTEALNALNQATLHELAQTVDDIYNNDQIRGVIFIGDGEKAFVAGADIRELSALSREDALALSEYGQGLFRKIENCPKPIIAAINGFALGGGCELAMACHIRIAVEHAKLGQPEVNLGIIPGYGGTQRLTQLVGRGRALELILTGDMIDAAEAHRIGVINHTVPDRVALLSLARQILLKILSKAPYAVAKAIDSVNAAVDGDDGYEAEARNFADCAATDDFKEGTSAFLEKRKPNFKGR